MIISKKQATFGIMLERPGLVRLMEPRGKSRAKWRLPRMGEEYVNMSEFDKGLAQEGRGSKARPRAITSRLTSKLMPRECES